MQLREIKFPNIYFYNTSTKKQVKLDASKDSVKVYTGSTKGRGPGKYWRVAGVKDGQKFSRMIGEETYKMLKSQLAGKSPKKSAKKSKAKKSKKSLCNRSKSGVRKSKAKCMKSKTCSWVSGKRGSRKGYCRRGSRK